MYPKFKSSKKTGRPLGRLRLSAKPQAAQGGPIKQFKWAVLILAICWLPTYAPAQTPPHQSQRVQPLQRLQWQFVPPHTKTINGRRITIEGHWHNRFAACPTCGDRTITRPVTTGPNVERPTSNSERRTNTTQAGGSVPPSTVTADVARLRDLLAVVQEQLSQIDQSRGQLADTAQGNTVALAALAEMVAGLQDQGLDLKQDIQQINRIDEGQIATVAAPIMQSLVDKAVDGELLANAGSLSWGAALASGLGIGGPPGLGIALGAWLLTAAIKGRRKRKKKAAAGGDEAQTAAPLESQEAETYRDYARQQAELYTATGGRDALWDQTIGRLFDQELSSLANNSQDDGLRQAYVDLRERVRTNARRMFDKEAGRSTLTTTPN